MQICKLLRYFVTCPTKLAPSTHERLHMRTLTHKKTSVFTHSIIPKISSEAWEIIQEYKNLL